MAFRKLGPEEKEAVEEAREEILVRSGQIGGRIGHHPVVKQFVLEIIERAKSMVLGISGR